MAITINEDTLADKIAAQITKNVAANFETQDLTDEEKQANMVLAKKAIERDAQAVAELILEAFAE